MSDGQIYIEPARPLPVIASADVLVAGGGPGGLFAALAAARAGARVVLTERAGYLGGNAVSGLPILGMMSARQEPLVGGLPRKFIARLVAGGAAVGPLPDPKHISLTPVNPEAFKMLADQACREAGIRVYTETWASAPVMNGRVSGAVVESKGGRGAILATQVIDATGDADLIAQSGAEVEKGWETNGAVQPSSLMFRIGGVDTDRFLEYLEANPDEVNPIGKPEARPFPVAYFRSVPRWAVAGLQGAVARAHAAGDFPADLHFLVVCLLPQAGQVAINGAKVLNCDTVDPVQRSAATVEARIKSWEIADFLRGYVPGFEHSELLSTHDILGVRESRRICGEYLLTAADVRSGAQFPDAVCQADYPIDIHSLDGSRSTFIMLEQPYDIPYRCLVPKSVDGLIVAGRPISVTSEAFGSVRTMGTCMGIGQAAGAAAALAARDGCEMRQIDYGELRALLRSWDQDQE